MVVDSPHTLRDSVTLPGNTGRRFMQSLLGEWDVWRERILYLLKRI